jgi:6-phosphogluconolactonase/glucosamine-6-phosphate isomerase/deaminase
LLSGGSALSLLERVKAENLGKNITLSGLDDRYSTDPEVNTYSQIASLGFYKDAMERGAEQIDLRVKEGETISAMAGRMEKSLRDWREKNFNGFIIATQGVGPDGHTAGIMPYPEDPEQFKEMFEDPSHWVTGYNAGDKHKYPDRVTTTMPFLRDQVDHAIVYMAGNDKHEAFRRVSIPDGSLAETPARIIKEMKGTVEVFTDQ